MTMKIARIRVNWNCEESIATADRRKTELENAGYNLAGTSQGLNTNILTYTKP
jgi:hypothetical protein